MGKLSKVLLVLIALLTIVTGKVVFASGPVEFEFKTIDNLCGHTLVGDIDGDNRNDIIMHCRHDNFDNHLAWFRYPDMTKYIVQHGDFFGDRFAVGDMDTDFWVKSDGTKGLVSQSWQGDLAAPEWVYFVDGKSKRALYLVNHTDDTFDDTYRPMKENMTVFGFGRSVNVKGRSIGVIDDAPRSFTIGFVEDSDFSNAKTIITSAYHQPDVSFGTAKKIK